MSDSDSDQAGVPLIEDISPSPEPQKKRKRNSEEEAEEPTKTAKKSKKKRPKKPQDIDDDALDSKLGVNHAIGHMDSQLMADHIAQRTRRFQPDLTEVEADDARLSGKDYIHSEDGPMTDNVPIEKHIKDTTEWTEPRTTDSLPEFLEKFAAPRRKKRGEKGRTLSDAPKVNGSPHTLVIAGAGLRAADLTRVLRVFQTKESMVQKLFAKHVKLKEAIQEVKGVRMGVGVGTPQRIFDLLEDGKSVPRLKEWLC